MTFWAPGWPGAVLRGLDIQARAHASAEVDWRTYEAPALVLSHAAALLVLQGLPLQHLFPPGGYMRRGDQYIHGPFLFVRGRVAAAGAAPMRLKHVAIALVTRRERCVTDASVLARVLQNIALDV